MESAFSWLSQLIEWFARWVPRLAVIRSTHGAVKFVRGAKAVALPPGLHFYWPLVTDFVIYPTARQGVTLRNQTIVTKDAKAVAVGGMLIYEVNDLHALIAQTHDPDDTIKDIALTAFHDVLCQKTWEDILAGQQSGKLDTDLKARVKSQVEKYGVNVLKAMLIDLSPCRVIRLIGSESASHI